MDPLSIMLAIVSTGVGVAVTLWSSRYYYVKGKPERASVEALIAAIRRESKAQRGTSADNPTEIPWKWALALIEAFERGEISLPELGVAARAIESIGELILTPIRSASHSAACAGMTLSAPWQEAHSKAISEGLAAVKTELKRKLGRS